jgi:predicted acetyltransferase
MCNMCGDGLRFFGLAEPQSAMLASYTDALRRGWSPNTTRDVSGEELAKLEADPAAYLADLTAPGSTTAPTDGTRAPPLSRIVYWMWDGEFCGAINLRFLPGTDDLPPHISGHLGYSVVPWKQRHGYATRALREMLDDAAWRGLKTVSITTSADNTASRRVIERNGGVRAGTWSHPTLLDGEAREYWTVDLVNRAGR